MCMYIYIYMDIYVCRYLYLYMYIYKYMHIYTTCIHTGSGAASRKGEEMSRLGTRRNRRRQVPLQQRSARTPRVEEN